MILPTKHLGAHESLLGLGAVVLSHLSAPKTVSRLWEDLRLSPELRTFDRFVLTLGFLYAIGTVEMDEGLLRRARP